MSLNGKNKLNKIEDLKSKLFSRGYKTKLEHRESFPHFQNKEVAESWEKKESADSGMTLKLLTHKSAFKKFFTFSLGFFVLALGYASYMFFAQNNTVSNDNIDIVVKSNAFTAGGEEYPLLLEIANKNSSALQLADLVIKYPKSSGSVLSQDNEHIRISLGTLPAGEVKNENIKFILFGEQGSIRPVKISLEYRVEGSNAIFVKDIIYYITISSTPINLLVEAPSVANSGQDISFNIKTTLNATKPVSKILLKIDYPIGFQFVKSTPMPSLGNNIWNLGDLAPGAERNISIVGRMIDVFDGEEKVFRIWSGSQSQGDKSSIGVVFNSLEHKILISKSSIDAMLVINGISDREYAVDTKTNIEGQIQWKNNLETKINNLVIRAKISGNAVNRNTIIARQGFYNSIEDTIVWDKNGDNGLSEIDPGESGVVSFSLSPLSLFSASGGLLSDPSINVDISVSGQQAIDGGGSMELSNKESKVVRIISDVGLSSKALYYSGVLKNIGPIPPRSEQKTTYTIVWFVSNTANNISKAQVRATIPSWVGFAGVFMPANEDLAYNALTREVIWNVGSILKRSGVTGAGKEVSFQVELLPSLSQVGTSPTVLNETTLTGFDDFANVEVRVRKPPLDIRLLSDPGFPGSGGVVTQ